MTEATIDVMVERMHAAGVFAHERDVLAVEEPLEIRLAVPLWSPPVAKTIAITMRTPGHDAELAAGFLFTEGIVQERPQIEHIEHSDNLVQVRVRPGADVDLAPLALCEPVLDAEVICRLPDALRDAQTVFAATGGLHASGLFDRDGRLHYLREDVGRHNALDKVIGNELLAGRLPAHDKILVVSGRASFELVQKSAMAGIPIMVAVGSPSSLAVQLATCTGMTLVGFARDRRFNVYAGHERVRPAGLAQRNRVVADAREE
jgi:FdhD protein